MDISLEAQQLRETFRRKNAEWRKWPQYAKKDFYKVEDLSFTQWEALAAIKMNGRLRGYMVGSRGWHWKWENDKVCEPTPKTTTMKSLIRRDLVYQMRRVGHSLENGYIRFTLDYDESVYGHSVSA